MHHASLDTVELLITDWSGVISDDRLPVYEANQRMFERRKIPRTSFKEWLAGAQSSPREVMAAKGIEEDPEHLFAEYTEIFGTLSADGMQPKAYPDALSFLTRVTGYQLPVAVVSSHPHEYVLEEAERYGTLPYLHHISGSAKHKAWEIIRIMNRRNVSAKHVAYLGDMTFDVQAARAAGVTAIAITTGYQARTKLLEARPDLVVDSLSELASLLKV